VPPSTGVRFCHHAGRCGRPWRQRRERHLPLHARRQGGAERPGGAACGPACLQRRPLRERPCACRAMCPPGKEGCDSRAEACGEFKNLCGSECAAIARLAASAHALHDPAEAPAGSARSRPRLCPTTPATRRKMQPLHVPVIEFREVHLGRPIYPARGAAVPRGRHRGGRLRGRARVPGGGPDGQDRCSWRARTWTRRSATRTTSAAASARPARPPAWLQLRRRTSAHSRRCRPLLEGPGGALFCI